MRGGGGVTEILENLVGVFLLRFRHPRVERLERGRQRLQPFDMGPSKLLTGLQIFHTGRACRVPGGFFRDQLVHGGGIFAHCLDDAVPAGFLIRGYF
jgi:hypothetical protein